MAIIIISSRRSLSIFVGRYSFRLFTLLTDDKSELLHLPGLRSKVDKSIENHVPGFKSKDELRDFVDAAFKSSWINAKRSSFCLRNANEMKSDPVMVEQIWEIFHVAKGKAQNLLNLEEEKGNHVHRVIRKELEQQLEVMKKDLKAREIKMLAKMEQLFIKHGKS